MSPAITFVALVCLLFLTRDAAAEVCEYGGGSGRRLAEEGRAGRRLAVKTDCVPTCDDELCEAVEIRDESVVRDAIQAGMQVVCYCTCNETTEKLLLHETAEFEAVAFANLMLDDPPKCNVDFVDKFNNTPLHDAAAFCNTPMASVFLTSGAAVELENEDDDTPLCVAAKTDDPNCAGIVTHLVEYGADICKPCNGTLAIDLAVNKIVKDIIEQNDGGSCLVKKSHNWGPAHSGGGGGGGGGFGK